MSIEKMVEVWNTAATGSAGERLVLLALADAANDDGTCFPSCNRIAEKTKIGVRQVRRHLEALEERGLVARRRRRRADGSLGTYLYTVMPNQGTLESASNGPEDAPADPGDQWASATALADTEDRPSGHRQPRITQRESKGTQHPAAGPLEEPRPDLSTEIARGYWDWVKETTGHNPPESYLAIRAVVLAALKADFPKAAIKQGLVKVHAEQRPITKQTLWAAMAPARVQTRHRRTEDPNELLDAAREAVADA